jgi:hypothetical protein
MADTPLHRHPRPHHELARRYRILFRRRDFVVSAAIGAIALAIGWFTNYYAIVFATERASNAVTDIVLSNIPVFDVDGFFVYGTLFFAGLSIFIVLLHPRRIPFAFKTVALFWIIRSFFTILTHYGTPLAHYPTEFSPSVVKAFFGGDLFFSAHTGMPFLGALAYWKEPGIRNICLIGTVYFGAVVLLGHLHYSTDVLSAIFITYTIYQIALHLFPKDAALFNADTLDTP